MNAADSPRLANVIGAPNPRHAARLVASTILGLFLVATLLIPAALANKVIFVVMFGLLVVAPAASAGRVSLRSLSPIVIVAIFLYGYAIAFVGQVDSDLANQLL